MDKHNPKFEQFEKTVYMQKTSKKQKQSEPEPIDQDTARGRKQNAMKKLRATQFLLKPKQYLQKEVDVRYQRRTDLSKTQLPNKFQTTAKTHTSSLTKSQEILRHEIE